MPLCVRESAWACVSVFVFVFILACLAHFLLSSDSAELQSSFWVVAAIAASVAASALAHAAVIEAQL